ncbi:MAG: TonB-dependent receptor [Parafilimonas sp.]
MQSKFYLFIVLILLTTRTFSQSGIITGKITDASNNQVLTGATISIKNSTIKTSSDVDGTYRLSHIAAGQYTLQITYIGYSPKEVSDVTVTNNSVVMQNITLSLQSNTTIQTVVVTTTSARRESLNSILTTRRNAAVVSDAISADMIKRSPDKSIGDVLKRVSGTSVQDNKFVVIRGMNDRYNEAMLNGAILPSTEPDRKTFAFDIFPADIVDNITITKSASPEYPASFAGGLIQVNLKDVPEKNFFSIKAGLGYNTITTGDAFYHDQKGNTDFLGLDDGTRTIPRDFPAQQKYNGLKPGQQVKDAKLFPNDWSLEKNPSAPLNTSIQISGGFNATDKNGYPKIGAILGLSYYSTYKFSKNFIRDFGYAKQISADSVDTGGPAYYTFNDSSYTHTILESALANFSCKLDANNKIFFNNLFAVNSSNLTDVRHGIAPQLVGGDFASAYYAYVHYFQSNVIYNTQFGGEHYIPKFKLKIKWQLYYTTFDRNEPDYRQMIYYKPSEDDPYYAYISSPTLFTTVTGGLRLYFETKDNGGGSNVDFNKSFKLFHQNQALKFGFFYYQDDRTRNGRFLRNDMPDYNQKLVTLPPNQIFADSNFDARKGFVTTDFAKPDWIYYSGSIQQTAEYIMFDNKFTDKLRLAWGVRYENYHNKLKSYKTNRQHPTRINNTYNDLLPSANFIYSVLPKANIRLSYSNTVARPLYRELASTLFYDFFQNATYYGGNLAETKIDNYEIRWEQYFPNAQHYSVSGFYKKFHNAIEPKIAVQGAGQ